MLKASRSIKLSTLDNNDQALGIKIVQAACCEPIRQMCLNAGESPDLIIAQVLKSKSNYGWDFRKGTMTDLYENGIIDPVKVTRSALQNGASCASTLITTNFGIIQTE